MHTTSEILRMDLSYNEGPKGFTLLAYAKGLEQPRAIAFLRRADGWSRALVDSLLDTVQAVSALTVELANEEE